jgi:hypothetical protein
MSAIAAFVPIVIFLVIFAVVGVRIWRIARVLLKQGAFRAAYSANLERELRKAGIDPSEIDMDSLRASKSTPTRVSPELQGAVIRAVARTLRLRAAAIDSDTHFAAPLAQTPPAGPAGYAEPYRPPAIDAPSKTRRGGIIVVVLLLLAAGIALALRQGA